MVLFTEKDPLKKALSDKRNKSLNVAGNYKLGFVPTMGALHNGHLSLVQKAVAENDTVVVSIFVNPTQFNNTTDLKKYPRNLEKDLALLEGLQKDLIVFIPEVADLYGQNIISNSYDFGSLENEMEGRHRSGHFDGVGTVLSKFFQIINPERAYFGEKAFQQLLCAI